MACTGTPLISLSAVLASRAETPMRSAPVASFTSAQRSLIPARVRSDAISAGNSLLDVVLNNSMRSVSEGRSSSAP